VNLHQDLCPARDKAIVEGMNLPLTPKEIHAHAKQPKRVAMQKMFDRKNFNQLLVLWDVRHSLLWIQIKDFILGIAFQYLCHVTKPYTCIWAATEAHWIYCNFQSKVLEALQSSLFILFGSGVVAECVKIQSFFIILFFSLFFSYISSQLRLIWTEEMDSRAHFTLGHHWRLRASLTACGWISLTSAARE
jgi:hypothetical protein